MPSEPQTPAPPPLGTFEYQLTDELAYQSSVALFEMQSRQVKESVLGEGMPHPAAPIVIGIGMLLLGQVAVLFWAWDWWPSQALFILACLVQLLLLFKAALYFWPAFARWYIRLQTRWWLWTLSHRTIRWTWFYDRLETKSAAIQRAIPWTDLTKVEVLSGFWFVYLKSGPPLMAPESVLSAELQDLIKQKVGGAMVTR